MLRQNIFQIHARKSNKKTFEKEIKKNTQIGNSEINSNTLGKPLKTNFQLAFENDEENNILSSTNEIKFDSDLIDETKITESQTNFKIF
jgi:hypothetical protein